MGDDEVRYVLLRDGRDWEAAVDGLTPTADGRLTLARVPGTAAGGRIDVAGPLAVALSGLSVGPDGCLYLADGGRIVRVDRRCQTSAAACVPVPFASPQQAGPIAADATGRLYVLGGPRVYVFVLPALELVDRWDLAPADPAAVACDSAGRVYVLDRAGKRVIRFDRSGVEDAGLRLDASVLTGWAAPFALAVDANDQLHLTDPPARLVHRFDPSTGEAAAEATPFEPGAVACRGDRLYCHARDDGSLWAFDLAAGGWLGKLPDYRGPVAALAVDAAGTLVVKPGADARYFELTADAASVAAGSLTTDLLDAGDRNRWEQVAVAADTPPGTRVVSEYLAADVDPPPAGTPWVAAPAADFLLPAGPRYVKLRVRLFAAADGRTGPALNQIEFATVGEDSRDYLPAVYARTDDGDVLRRFLDLFRSEWRGREHQLDEMHRRFDARTAAEDSLPWLADWLAFALPRRQDPAAWRDTIARVPQLLARRGTPAGLAEWVELYTGVAVRIVEQYRFRRVWQLDTHSVLGFDTLLPAADADGLIVPDPAAELIVGQAVVGASAPAAKAEWGEILFAPEAHLFTAFACGWHVPCDDQRAAVRAVLDAEKPAYTDYQLCFVEPTFRVGVQAAVGLDAYVAPEPPPLRLDDTRLDVDARLDPAAPGPGYRVGVTVRS